MKAGRSTILLVDDLQANLTALEGILAPLGQRLLLATSGEEALKRLMQEEDVALILLDVRMPGLDGYETARLIKQRERTRYIPIIFLTGLGEDEGEIFRAYEYGAVDYIRKPVDPAILRSKAKVFVELHARDVALREQAALLREHELAALERRSEERYRTLIDAMPQCVWALTPEGEIAYANEVWRRYAGLGRGETRVEVLRRYVHPEDIPVGLRVWRRAFEKVEPVEFQLRLRRVSDGAWRWHLARGVPDRDEKGRVAGWVITATDIDDQKRVEEALQRAEQALRRAAEAKDVFLAAASHELRTPLTVAKAQTAMALRRLGETDAGKPLATIDRQIARLVRLVEDLLDLGRLQAERLELDCERFDLVELVREVAERMQLLSEAHPISVEAPGELFVTADRSRLEQVVTNLISNAVRYSPHGGAIEIGIAREGDGAHLRFRDHGIGIPPERQAEIFERFGLAHGGGYGGLGLGLTIAHGIVERHGGRLWVESRGIEGEGSTFHVELPLVARAEGSAGGLPVLVDDARDDQQEGDQPQDVEPGARLELRAHEAEEQPVDRQHPEGAGEDGEEPVPALPPEA